MEYIPSNTEDAKLHTIFHNASVGGANVPRALLERARSVRSCGRKSRTGDIASGSSKNTSEARDLVVEVDRKDPLAARNLVGKVLEVVETELGAVRIETEELWSQVVIKIAIISSGTIPLPMTTTLISGSPTHPGSYPPREVHRRPTFPRYDKYKAYLYIQNNKCLGLCLAERIFEAHKVLPQITCLNSSSISICQDKSPAVVGISRIWVSREHRGAGIARELLETARQYFAGGLAVPKEMMAFSQPTESGIKLATAWFNNSHGWLVYTEPPTRL